jgi:hypothetical protein
MLQVEYVGMFMIYFTQIAPMTCQLLSPNQKPSTYFVWLSCHHCSASYKKTTLTKHAYLSIYYHTEFQDPSISDTNIVPISEDCMVIMLVLLMVQN